MAKASESEASTPSSEPQVPAEAGNPPTSDPRDVTIRTLQTVLTAVSAIAICLVVAVVILAVRGMGGSSSGANTSSINASGSSTPTATVTPVFGTQYVSVNPNVKAGAIIVEIHSDYQCPWCERSEQIYGEALHELSQSGDIDLRIHIRTLVGDQIIKNDSSERAGIAALCADKVGQFWAYHSAVFANQPTEGVGYTDQQLRVDFAAQAGITDQNLTDFQSCYDSKATAAAVTSMEQEGVQLGVNATPTFFVNGIQVNFDLQANASTITPITTADLLAGLQKVAG